MVSQRKVPGQQQVSDEIYIYIYRKLMTPSVPGIHCCYGPLAMSSFSA